jgi:hypothetical protein
VFEHRHQRPIPFAAFLRRQVRHGLIAGGIIAGSLALGVLGYHQSEGMPWIDALLNAAMLLGGMGPVSELHSTGGKLFASFYALYCGVVFIFVVGVLFAPSIHRFLHRFHLEMDEKDAAAEKPAKAPRRAR